MKVKSEECATYKVAVAGQRAGKSTRYMQWEDGIIAKALEITEARLLKPKEELGSPGDSAAFLTLRMAPLEHEVFACVWLNAQNRAVAYEEMFRGTLTQTAVYPREVVKRAMHHNASAVVFAHNHPSGICAPSSADEQLTRELKKALAMVDVRVVDHIIVGGTDTFSFAEKGLI